MAAQTIIFHEYTHHFVHHNFPGGYPSWLSEGLAEYFSTTIFKEDVADVGGYSQNRVYGLDSGYWIPIAKLFDPSRDRNSMREFYPESWLVTHYFMDDPVRREKLTAYLDAMWRGTPGPEAFKQVFGMDYEALDEDVRAYLRRRSILIRRIPSPRAGVVDIKVSTLAPAADDFLLHYVRFVTEIFGQKSEAAIEHGKDTLRDIRRKTARYPDDGLAQRTLAAAEMVYGDLDAAHAILDKVLTAVPEDLDALYLKAGAYFIAGQRKPEERAELWAKARPLAGKIYQLDPNHYPGLYIYGIAALAQPGRPTENTLNVITLAHQLAPQVMEITMNAASGLARGGRLKEAKQFLSMLAFNPHLPEDDAAHVQDLLAAIEKEMAAQTPESSGN